MRRSTRWRRVPARRSPCCRCAADHFTAAEYGELTKRATASIGLGKQAAFTVPYVGHWSTPAEREQLLGSAPLPFRILYRLTRRRHDRLTELALGEAAVPPATT